MTLLHRPYQGVDDLTHMQALIAQGSDLHVGDIPHRIYNGLRQYEPAEVVHLWWDDAQVLQGFVMISPRETFFEIQLMEALYAAPQADELFRWAEAETLRLAGDEKGEVIKTDWVEGSNAQAALLTRLGYHADQAYLNVTERSLGETISQPTLPPGFTIRSAAGDHEAAQLCAVHSGAFGSSWTVEAYRKLMHTPGYDPARERVVVAPDGQFAAFCIYWLDEVNKTGLFEPVGTHHAFQRQGLARALMLDTLHLMQTQGMTSARVTYKLDNPASTGLYTGLGFRHRYTVWEYHKKL